MAPGGVTRKKKSETNNSQSPLFSSGVRPNPDSPIERGIQGLQKRTKKTHNPSSGPPEFSDEAIEESTEITQNESDESNQNQFPDDASADTGSTSKKRTRGLTMGRNIMKSLQATGSKLKITVDPLIGRPIDTKESAKLASQIGVVTRDVLQVPKRWKDVDKEKDLNVGFDHLNIHMDVNMDDPGVKDCLVDRVKNSMRQRRFLLHQHFKTFATLEEAKRNMPSSCGDQNHWETLCDYFSSEKFKRASAVNRDNRKQVKVPHVSGRKAFTVLQHEISQKELNGETCDRIELYKRTHSSEKKGWASATAEENWNLMKEKQNQYNEEEIVKTTADIAEEVLGRGSGYIKGLGYGPKPPSRRNSSHDFDRQQLQKEHLETLEKLKNSEAQVEKLTAEVTSMNDKISEQDDKIEMLMQFMKNSGHGN